ncbi:type II secretion system protein GspM [Sulfitobacter sp.]|uniref:type II secretion system protein GspM n=1 Tax=Sulfitobacter sp. TaxID=1903071 RepID=UPI003F6AA0D1|tara:strand:+ start:1253 stop:1711 length:459 start_codon:yes stop_codon:yes gene_type:complete
MNAFHRLSLREKILVLIALPLVTLFAGYQYGWVPLSEARMAARAEIRGYQTLIAAVENQGNQPAQLGSVPVITTPLATRITDSANLAGVLVRRLEPEGAMVRVSLDDAPYDTVIGWIAAMETDAAIALVALEMDRKTAPGIVAARLTLETAK